MAVIWGIEQRLEYEVDVVAPIREGRKCFHCGDPVVFPAVMWMGSQDIYFHADCAAELAAGLLADWKRVQRGPTSAWAREASRRERDGLTADGLEALAAVVDLDSRRAFSANQKAEIFRRCRGRCIGCGLELEMEGDWHADHMYPHALGGKTDVRNGLALCGPCNLRKSNHVLLVEKRLP